MADIPQYVINPSVMRLVIPQVLVTFILAIVFFVGIAINVKLLGVRIPRSVGILIVVVLVLLVVIQGLLSYLQASKTRYSIFTNRIQIDGEKQNYIMFNAIQSMQSKKDLFDKIFKTGTLVFEPKMKIKAIPNFDQNFAYLQQLLQYSRTQYRQV